MLKFLLLLFPLLINASGTGWGNDFEAAKARAAKEGKSIYVLITTERCRWCKKMKQTTLADPGIRARISRLSVPVELTRNVDRYPGELKAPMVPMHYFLDAQGAVLAKFPGYWGGEDFNAFLDDVERKMK